MSDEKYIMWLTYVLGIGSKRYDELINKFGNAQLVYNAKISELQKMRIPENIIKKIIDCKANFNYDDKLEQLHKKGIKFITRENPIYPPRLKNIPDPPIALYMKGELPTENGFHASIVGARRCSEYGSTMAYSISKGLGAIGAVIVSGLATGIDSVAHKAALDVGARTIAVLGCGVDICYPPQNRDLYEKIAQQEQCCILSEFPPEVKAMPYHFPMRNRIVSGLSDALIIVEAAKGSGTFTTVDHALDQGKYVFAVPGNATSKLSEGTNLIIKEGAYLITDHKDVLEHFEGLLEIAAEQEEKPKQINLNGNEIIVYNLISKEPVSIEFLMSKLDINMKDIQSTLMLLELKQYITSLPGQRYILKI